MEILDYISTERLSTYEKHTGDKKKAIALHNHTLQLGSSLMSMIALLELSLRNSTNKRLIEHFGDPDWSLPEHTTLPLRLYEKTAISTAHSRAQKSAYSKLNYKEKRRLDADAFPDGKPLNITHRAEVKQRQALFSVSHGQVISQTMFSFWKSLYSKDYKQDLWKPALKKVFPNKSLKRGEIANWLEDVYKTRNRVAHHEPVYGERLEEAMTSLNSIRNALGARKAQDDTSFKRFSRVHHLRLRMDYESFMDAWDVLT